MLKMKQIYYNNIVKRKTINFIEMLTIWLTILGIMFFYHIQIKWANILPLSF